MRRRKCVRKSDNARILVGELMRSLDAFFGSKAETFKSFREQTHAEVRDAD